MDNLLNTMAQRSIGGPTQPKRVPPAWERWLMAEMMKRAYLNNWSPNPVIMKVLGEKVYGKPEQDPKRSGESNGSSNPTSNNS